MLSSAISYYLNMDGREEESWLAKAERIRSERRAEQKAVLATAISHQDQNAPSLPKRLLDIAADSIPVLSLAWREIFEEYWRARDPQDIEVLRAAESARAGAFFDEETKRAKDEIRKLLSGPAFNPLDEGRIENASSQLMARCSEARPQCQALVDRLAAESARAHSLRNQERYWRLAEVLLVSVLSAAGSAIVGYFLHDLSSKESAEQLATLKDHVRATDKVAAGLAERVTVLAKVSPPFALVDEDGRLVFEDSRFKKYGLSVAVTHEGSDQAHGWRYRYHFSKPPHAVLFFSQKGAAPSRKTISKSEMEVRYISPGFGGATIKSDSVIQILEP
jgi:hypothetical protein